MNRLDQQAIQEALDNKVSSDVAAFRSFIKQIHQSSVDAFLSAQPITKILANHSQMIDEVIKYIWHDCYDTTISNVTLVALGGYGRGELLLYSDLDILVLCEHPSPPQCIEKFISLLWDIGLTVSQMVCSISQMLSLARDDIQAMTSLLDSRYIIGDHALYQKLLEQIQTGKIWHNTSFFTAKIQEQTTRYQKYGDTSYNLEPNVKEGPGALRDLQTIGWITKYHFKTTDLHHLVGHDFLTENEFAIIDNAHQFLLRVRFALHYVAQHKEERLLFDHQNPVAYHFGHTAASKEQNIEKFMKRYYRIIKAVNAINDMLLQLFREDILLQQTQYPPEKLNDSFQVRNHYIELIDEKILLMRPSTMLEIFVLMTQHPNIKGVAAKTIRSLRDHLYLIDTTFRHDPQNQTQFMTLLKQSGNIALQLRRMNRYGILGKYLPCFEDIIGQMQYDLFHSYTVDQHLIFLLSKIYEFSEEKSKKSLFLCYQLIHDIPKRALLYLAALFHDIGKGHGCDHSQLGATLVTDFCHLHQLTDDERELVTWLVANHLLMSMTAQQMDIDDPEVIANFATQVATKTRLDYLYLLTVADISATNPTLWNSWRNALLKKLYQASKNFLAKPESQKDIHDITAQNKQLALQQLVETADQPPDDNTINSLWRTWNKYYFLHTPVPFITRHTQAILTQKNLKKPLILVSPQISLGGTEVFIYTPVQPYLFATITATLDKVRANIVSAEIHSTTNGYMLETFIILDKNGNIIEEPYQLQMITTKLQQQMAIAGKRPKPVKRLTSRRMKHFSYPSKISFREDQYRQRSIMKFITPDRAGLLALIGIAFAECQVHLESAKIVTMGERVEDIFFITKDGAPLDHQAQQSLQAAIKRAIGE